MGLNLKYFRDDVLLKFGVQTLGEAAWSGVRQNGEKGKKIIKIGAYFACKPSEFMYHENAHLLDKPLRHKNQFNR